MKKFFVIFLTLILALGVVSVCFAESRSEIEFKLDEIESNILENNLDLAKENLAELREAVYSLARDLVEQNKYTSEVFDIIGLAAKAIETKNIEYIAEARMILSNIFNKDIKVIESNHS